MFMLNSLIQQSPMRPNTRLVSVTDESDEFSSSDPLADIQNGEKN